MPPQDRLSQVSLGPSGSAGARAPAEIIAAAAQQQQQNTAKLFQTIQQLQQANAQENERARQSVAGGVSEVLNSAVSGMEKARQERLRQEERVEDREFQVDFAEFQAKMAQELQQDAQRVGQEIQSQREAVIRFMDQFEEQRTQAGQGVAAMREQLNTLQANGHFDFLDDGIERYQAIDKAIDRAEARWEDHFHDNNLAEVPKMLNQVVRDIQAGRETMDLTGLQVDPFLVEYPETQSRGGDIDLDPEDVFTLKNTKGYPEDGVLFTDQPEGAPAPRMLDPRTLKKVLFADSVMTQMTDQRNRSRFLDKIRKTTMETQARLGTMMERRRGINKIMVTRAPVAVDSAIQEFIDNPNPAKFDNFGKNLFFLSMKNMWPENTDGAKLAATALDVFEGKKELKSAPEFWVASGLESASFTIGKQLQDGFLSAQVQLPDGRNVTAMEAMLRQISDQRGPEALASFLGSPRPLDLDNGPQLAMALRMGTNRIADARSFATRVHQGLVQESALTEFVNEYGSTVRMADVLAMHNIAQDAQNKAKLDNMLSGVMKGAEEASQAGPVPPVQRTEGFEKMLTLADAMAQVAQEAGGDVFTEMAVALSGGAEDITSPNFEAYKQIFEMQSERDPAAKWTIDRRRRRQDAKLGGVAGAVAGIPGALGKAGSAAAKGLKSAQQAGMGVLVGRDLAAQEQPDPSQATGINPKGFIPGGAR